MVESDTGNMKRKNAYQGLKKNNYSYCNDDVGLKKNSCLDNNTQHMVRKFKMVCL